MFARKAFFFFLVLLFGIGGSLSGRATTQLLNVLGECRPGGSVGQLWGGGQEVQAPASCGQKAGRTSCLMLLLAGLHHRLTSEILCKDVSVDKKKGKQADKASD